MAPVVDDLRGFVSRWGALCVDDDRGDGGRAAARRATRPRSARSSCSTTRAGCSGDGAGRASWSWRSWTTSARRRLWSPSGSGRRCATSSRRTGPDTSKWTDHARRSGRVSVFPRGRNERIRLGVGAIADEEVGAQTVRARQRSMNAAPKRPIGIPRREASPIRRCCRTSWR